MRVTDCFRETPVVVLGWLEVAGDRKEPRGPIRYADIEVSVKRYWLSSLLEGEHGEQGRFVTSMSCHQVGDTGFPARGGLHVVRRDREFVGLRFAAAFLAGRVDAVVDLRGVRRIDFDSRSFAARASFRRRLLR